MCSIRYIALVILVCGLNISVTRGTDHKVNNEGELRYSLKKAIPFDTLSVYGFYCIDSALLVEKPLYIRGMESPCFDFQSKSSGLLVLADSVTITGLSIHNIKHSNINDYAAIHVEDAENVHIKHNKIYNAFFGIYLANSKKSSVTRNYVWGISTIEQSTGNAVHLWHCDSMLIDSNRLFHHRDGVYLEFVTHSKVVGNLSRFNIRYGLHFMFSHDDLYENNQFLDNAAGVAVMYSKNVAMINNTFKDNWGDCSYGLLLKDIYDGELTGNTFHRNTIALLMEGTNRLAISENEFVRNGWACKIAANCEGNEINFNQFKGNSFDVSTNGHTVMNGFNGNYWDHYEGYDLNHDGVGDIPYYPVSLFSVMVERVPESLMLYRSFFTFLLDKSEHVMPSITPSGLVDNEPLMSEPKTLKTGHAYHH